MFKSKKVVDLEAELKRVNERLTEAREDRDIAVLEVARLITDHRSEVEIILMDHDAIVKRLELEKKNLENSIKDKIAAGIDSEVRKLKAEGVAQEKRYTERMAKLEKEYAEKIARCDAKLESDKASYRKYLRQEHNTKLENLEKENRKLSGEIAELRGVNIALGNMNGTLTGQVESTISLMEGLVKALPTVTAEFTTPEIPSNSVTVGSGNKS